MRKYFIFAFLVCVTGILFAEPAKKADDSRRFDDAYTRIKKSQEYDSSDAMANIKKMYIKIDKLSKQKKYPEALKICGEIESRLLVRYKEYNEALSAVSLARAYVVKSRIYSNMDDFTQAVDYMRKVVHLYERHLYLIQSDQYSRLKSLLEQREKELDDINYAKSIKQANKLYDSGKYDAVEKKLKGMINQELKIKPLHNKRLAHLNFLLGRNLIMQRDKSALGPLEKSLHYYSKIQEGKNEFLGTYLSYDFYTFLSLAYNWNNKPEKSLKYAKLAYLQTLKNKKQNSPELIKCTFALAVAYRKCNDKKNAMKYGEKTLELFKKHPMFYKNVPRTKRMLDKWRNE